jgi:hypothetical protein
LQSAYFRLKNDAEVDTIGFYHHYKLVINCACTFYNNSNGGRAAEAFRKSEYSEAENRSVKKQIFFQKTIDKAKKMC